MKACAVAASVGARGVPNLDEMWGIFSDPKFVSLGGKDRDEVLHGGPVLKRALMLLIPRFP